MNDENLNQRELELATAARLPASGVLAAETVELREGWQVFAQGLPTSATDDATFAARLARELSSSLVMVQNDRRPTNWTLAGAMSAVAAAALVAVGLWLASRSSNAPIARGSPEKMATNSTTTSIGDSDAWDDPLDARIAEMQDQLAEFAGDGPRLDASLSAFGQELSLLADDLDFGSL